jgi:hypothetical protein
LPDNHIQNRLLSIGFVDEKMVCFFKHKHKDKTKYIYCDMNLASLFKEILTENAAEIFQKYYQGKVPHEAFVEIIDADPYTRGDKVGKYSKWLLNLYIHGKLKLEDLYKAHEYLTLFDKSKAVMKRDGLEIDINKYTSLPQLYRTIEDYEDEEVEDNLTDTQLIKRIKEKEAEKFYEDNDWTVIIPQTQRASCLYGKGTKWCTASTGSYNYFDDYNRRGALYIMISKEDPKVKYQLHMGDAQFMDVYDDAVCPEDIVPFKLLKAILDREKMGSITYKDAEVRYENGQWFLYIDDYADFAGFFCEDEQEWVKTLLGGDGYSLFESHDTSYIEVGDWLDKADEKNLQKIREKLLEMAGDDYMDNTGGELTMEMLQGMDSSELEELINEYAEDLGDTIKYAADDAQASVNESEAWSHTLQQVTDFLGLRDKPEYIEIEEKGKKKGKYKYQMYNVKGIWRMCGFECEDDGECCEVDQPYYGFSGDVKDSVFNEILSDKLHDL